MLHEEGWETLKHLIETRRELKRCECRLEDIVEKFLNVEVVRWLAYAEKKKKREKILEKKMVQNDIGGLSGWMSRLRFYVK